MFQGPGIAALLHGWSGLALAYGCVGVPLLAGLIRGRAPLSRLIAAPALAVPVTFLTCMILAVAATLAHGLSFTGLAATQLAVGAAAAAALGYASGCRLARIPSNSGYRRGAVVSDTPAPRERRESSTRARTSARAGHAGQIRLAGIPVAAQDETKHFKLIGTTGTGKSTAIHELLRSALARGDAAIIADPDRGYLRRFHDRERGDVILSPFDADSPQWDLFGEIASDHDADQLARSLIPDHGETDRSWSEYARTLFTAVAQQTSRGAMRDVGELHRILTRAPVEELRMLLAGTAAEPFLEAGNERMFGSVRSVTSSAVRGLKYVIAQRAAPFSIRRWVSEEAARPSERRGRVLFLPYRAGEIAALGSTISAWMRIAIFEAMSQPETDQRLWLIVDELDALGEIDGLKDALARLRKFGGRAVLGFQSIAQVSGIYGRAAAGTLVENCGNTLILRCSASEHGGTSQFASRLIGDRQVMHATHSRTHSLREWLGSTTTSEHLA
ncbi:MAG: type IV secretion system DNA-binding domain-containing protein, partial [Steroidobacteraceae bacterium]